MTGVGLPFAAARLVEQDDRDPDPLVVVRGGEAGDLLPGRRPVRALPEAGLARPEVEDAGLIGIDGEPLAHRAAVLVAAHLHRHVDRLPGVAAIVRTEDGAVADPRAGVRSRGQVDLVGVDRIGRQALDAEEVRVAPQLIGERDPGLAGRVPAVGAADVGAGVDQPLLDGAEDDAADEAAAENDDVLPVVGRAPLQAAARHSLGRGRRNRRGRPARRLRRHATGADGAGRLAQHSDDPRQRTPPRKFVLVIVVGSFAVSVSSLRIAIDDSPAGGAEIDPAVACSGRRPSS